MMTAGAAAGRGREPFQERVQNLARGPTRHVPPALSVVALDGFTGYKTAAAEAVPDAVAVSATFHVVALAGDKLD